VREDPAAEVLLPRMFPYHHRGGHMGPCACTQSATSRAVKNDCRGFNCSIPCWDAFAAAENAATSRREPATGRRENITTALAARRRWALSYTGTRERWHLRSSYIHVAQLIFIKCRVWDGVAESNHYSGRRP